MQIVCARARLSRVTLALFAFTLGRILSQPPDEPNQRAPVAFQRQVLAELSGKQERRIDGGHNQQKIVAIMVDVNNLRAARVGNAYNRYYANVIGVEGDALYLSDKAKPARKKPAELSRTAPSAERPDACRWCATRADGIRPGTGRRPASNVWPP